MLGLQNRRIDNGGRPSNAANQPLLRTDRDDVAARLSALHEANRAQATQAPLTNPAAEFLGAEAFTFENASSSPRLPFLEANAFTTIAQLSPSQLLPKAVTADLPLVVEGDTGVPAQSLARALWSLGLVEETSDRVDANMKKAVEGFQKSQQITIDGKVGPQTWRYLLSAVKRDLPTLTLGGDDHARPTAVLRAMLNASKFPVAETGIYGPGTVNAVKAFQQAAGISADGHAGPITFRTLMLWPIRADPSTGGAVGNISARAIKLIKDFESHHDHPLYPGGQSGVTIGWGYDTGYVSRAEFNRDWAPFLSASALSSIGACCGRRGSVARGLAASRRHLRIPESAGDKVFERATLPKFHRAAQRTFPGFDRLNPNQKGALVSLVYNRGTSMRGDRRREMRQVRDAIGVGDIGSAARAIRNMKRLWVGQGLDGLLRRRDAEADLLQYG